MERLTQQEEEVMIYFWKMGPSFIREILNEMPEALPLWSVTWRRRSFYLLLS